MPDGFDDVILAQRLVDKVHADWLVRQHIRNVLGVEASIQYFAGKCQCPGYTSALIAAASGESGWLQISGAPWPSAVF